MRRRRGLYGLARAAWRPKDGEPAIAILKTCKRINSHAHAGLPMPRRKGKRRRHVTLTGSRRHVPFPTFPHTTGSEAVTANVSHHEAKSAVILWMSKNLNNPHAPRGFQKGLTLVSFGLTGCRQHCLGFSILCPCIDKLARSNFSLASICSLLWNTKQIGRNITAKARTFPRDEARFFDLPNHLKI